MVSARISVLRTDPQAGPGSNWRTYAVEMPDGSTVLEALMLIQDSQDGTLAFRRACRHAICGSCAMRVNGCAKLACNTQLSLAADQAGQMATHPGRRSGRAPEPGDDDASRSRDDVATDAPEPGAVTVAPVGNMPVVKDLVTDMDAFWAKLRRTRPYLVPADERPDPDRERLQSPDEWDRMAQGLLCVECGACYSDCSAVKASPEFVGPTALVKASRHVTDSRDIDEHRRLGELSGEHGLWECMRCYFCSQRCPKHIRVRELIAQLGTLAYREELRSDAGARHAEAFVASLKESGRLNETTLAVRSQGWLWSGKRVPLAVRVALAGKLGLPPRKIDDHEALLRVIDAAQRLEAAPGDEPPLRSRGEGVES